MNKTPSSVLEQEHRQIDTGIEGILNDAGSSDELLASLDLLRRHLYIEEDILFPLLEDAGLTMPVFVMNQEHGMMWPLLKKLTQACKSGDSMENIKPTCQHLFRLLCIHNPKEEDVLYTAANKLAEEEHTDLVANIENAIMPEDWVCAMAN